MLKFWPSVGERKYNWEKKQVARICCFLFLLNIRKCIRIFSFSIFSFVSLSSKVLG